MIDLDNDTLNERDGRESDRKKRPENKEREGVDVCQKRNEGGLESRGPNRLEQESKENI